MVRGAFIQLWVPMDVERMVRLFLALADGRIPDMDLPASHPKKAFMRRIIELEIRLAYHDRILDSLPEVMSRESSDVSPAAPEPFWSYEKEGMSDTYPS